MPSGSFDNAVVRSAVRFMIDLTSGARDGLDAYAILSDEPGIASFDFQTGEFFHSKDNKMAGQAR